MNGVFLTGWLPSPAKEGRTDTGARAVEFNLMVQDAPGHSTPWHCRWTLEPLAMPPLEAMGAGKAIFVRGRLCGREFVRAGVTSGFSRWIEVLEIEIPDRSRAKDDGGRLKDEGKETTAESGGAGDWIARTLAGE